MTDIPELFTLDDVLDEQDARAAARKASNVGAQAELAHLRAAEVMSDAERDYRRALAARITELHSSGVAWTVCADLARGDDNVSALRHARDMARSVMDAGKQRGFRLAADRRSLDALTEWSMKQALAMNSSNAPVPETVPIGSRRAA